MALRWSALAILTALLLAAMIALAVGPKRPGGNGAAGSSQVDPAAKTEIPRTSADGKNPSVKKPAGTQNKSKSSNAASPLRRRRDRVQTALSAPVTIDLVEKSPAEVLRQLEEVCQLPWLVRPSVHELLQGEPAEWTIQLRDAPLATVLDLALEPMSLRWTVHDDVVVVSTAYQFDEPLISRTYSIADLMPTPEEEQKRLDVATEEREDLHLSVAPGPAWTFGWLLEQTVDPSSWALGGGRGVTSPLRVRGVDLLVVSHTRRMQDQIARMLAEIRAHRRRHLRGGEVPPVEQDAPPPSLNAPLLAALQTRRDVSLKNQTLLEVIAQLRCDWGVPIHVDREVVLDVKDAKQPPVDLKLSQATLEATLNLLLAGREVDWTPRDGVIWIAPQAQIARVGHFRMYDVTDLLARWKEIAARASGRDDHLIKLVRTTISGEADDERSDKQVVRPMVSVFRQGEVALLMVWETWEHQRAIATLLEQLEREVPNANEKKPEQGERTSEGAAWRRIDQALARRSTFDYQRMALGQMLADYREQLGIDIAVDARLQRPGERPAISSVTLRDKNLSYREALDMILPRAGLDWTVREGVLWIFPMEADDEEQLLSFRCYRLWPETDYDTLVDGELLRRLVAPRTWATNGGQGEVMALWIGERQLLLVRQFVPIHEQIASLLWQVESAASGNTPDRSPGNLRIRQALQRRANFSFGDEPLSALLAAIERNLGEPIRRHRRAYDRSPNVGGLQAGFSLRGVTYATALDLLLQPRDLQYTVRDGAVWVITADGKAAESIRTWNVTDLVTPEMESDQIVDTDALLQTLITAIEPFSWDGNGGRYEAQCLTVGDQFLLIVWQTEGAHRQIETLLADLRRETRRGAPVVAHRRAIEEKLPARPQDPAKLLEQQPELAPLVMGNTAFACDLYRRMAAGSERENLLVAPQSLSAGLSMVYLGARGETATELSKSLHLETDANTVAALWGKLRKSLAAQENQEGYDLAVATRLWSAEGEPFRPDYLRATAEHFGAPLEAVDFTSPGSTAAKINRWVAQQTRGKIDRLASADSFDENTRLFLADAVYFRADWQAPFAEHDTSDDWFHAPAGKLLTPLMHQTTQLRYALADGVQVLELPYRGGRFAMLVLLPANEADSLARLEQSLSPQKIDGWLGRLRHREVSVWLPRFRIEGSYDLRRPLRELGIDKAFVDQLGVADLSGINGSRNLYVDQVVQKTFLNVNERGTEAAAATGISGIFGGPMHQPRPVVFRADQPYIFLLRDALTGSLLFVGRVVAPEKA